MANTINYAKNYVANLDKIFKRESLTNDLMSDPATARQGKGAKEIVYPQISVNGLGDYDRNSGYTNNAVTFVWRTAEFNYDRGTKISVDVMDTEETRNLAFGMAGAELERTKVVPEADAFTFAKLAGTTGISKVQSGVTYSTADQFLDGLLTAKNKMDEDEVPEDQRLLYVTPTLLNGVIRLDTTKSREILDCFAKIIAVPQSRFYTAIDLLDGSSSGEEAGHYAKASAGKDINFMIIHKPAVLKFDKHHVSDIIPAALNPDADADILKYRKYGLVDVYKNKVAGIYLSHKAT